MFCLEIPKLPFGWQPCYFRHLPCFIHISSVQAAKLKSSRPDVFDPSDVLMRSLTLQSLFSTSLSPVSFSPDDWAPSVSTTLGYDISIRGVYPFKPGSMAWLWVEAGCSHHHVRLNGPACESFLPVSCSLLPVLRVSSSPSLSDCCSCGAEPPAVTMPEGQPASFPCQKKKKKQKRRAKINSSLNKFVKAASKGVQHLLWHSCQSDATLRMWRVTWQITRTSVEEEGVAFVLALIDRLVMARWCTNHNANQWGWWCWGGGVWLSKLSGAGYCAWYQRGVITMKGRDGELEKKVREGLKSRHRPEEGMSSSSCPLLAV